jgi:uncharacterized protein
MARKAKQVAACSICGKPVQADYKPFCSKRCADVDLHRWLSGAYVIGGEAVEEGPPSPPAAEAIRRGPKA